MQQRRVTRIAAVATVLSAALLTAGCQSTSSAGSDEGETFTLTFSQVAAETSPEGIAAEKLKELLEERTEGRIEVEVYHNGSLYSQNDQMQALQSNAVQMIAASGANFTTVAPSLQVLSLPFLFDSPADVPEVITRDSAVGASIYENPDLADKNVKVLSIWSAGMKHLGDNEPIRTPADMSGHSYRIQSSDILVSQFEAWGAQPTVMAFSEVYTGLEQGLIDGQENTYANMQGQSMHTVQKYITESSHGLLDMIVAVNLDFYESLPEDLRTILDSTLDDVAEFNYSEVAKTNDDARQVIVDAGTTEIIELTDAERQQWVDMVVPEVWHEFESVIGADVLAELLEARQ
ncbi:DctP family TRAP transporter solute-binding subunit [Salinibacterium sp. dk2585]|uniref:DctP family TRAP transporter solute-binding subunit n=1 Tax=unclassified Salinibacterium TaxID=2632331 RepID=UPI0011C25768|nr:MULTISPECIES: DctP family TRAP transporter solute-binding subunit [unclassified Salinibacterium]QEE62316.1 DctP family TRAP transporter solute-binding subunit [Salinibacterium sp. dk2585]TXK53667.1 DctP family TRAP transporter solute-binding subunit [Salinibacterium sp. dk5596]